MPVQLIFGSEDQLTPPSLGHDLNELLPNAQLEVLDGAGHLSNIEAPEAFNATVRTFLAQHRSLASFAE